MATANEGMPPEQVMAGVLALLAADREDRLRSDGAEPRRTEVVLADAGLTAAQIGRVLGKKPNSVTKTITRAKGKADNAAAGTNARARSGSKDFAKSRPATLTGRDQADA